MKARGGKTAKRAFKGEKKEGPERKNGGAGLQGRKKEGPERKNGGAGLQVQKKRRLMEERQWNGPSKKITGLNERTKIRPERKKMANGA